MTLTICTLFILLSIFITILFGLTNGSGYKLRCLMLLPSMSLPLILILVSALMAGTWPGSRELEASLMLSLFGMRKKPKDSSEYSGELSYLSIAAYLVSLVVFFLSWLDYLDLDDAIVPLLLFLLAVSFLDQVLFATREDRLSAYSDDENEGKTAIPSPAPVKRLKRAFLRPLKAFRKPSMPENKPVKHSLAKETVLYNEECETEEPTTRMDVIFERIKDYMENKQPYLEYDFQMSDMAEAVYTNKSYVSKTINAMAGKNFCQFVNSYRVRYAVHMMHKNPKIKVGELALMSGFSSMVSFDMAFKLHMNTTPSEYLRSIQAEKL